jgi:hypothetical protein
MNKVSQEDISEAKEVLRKAGYFVDNLWHVDDVKLRFAVFDNEDAQDVLNDALTNEWVMEQIHYSIGDIAEYKGFKSLEDED